MIQTRQHLRVAIEPHFAIGVVSERLQENTQRNITAKFPVSCPTNLAHAASPNRSEGRGGPLSSSISLQPVRAAAIS